MSQPRQKDVIVAHVKNLRSSDPLAEEIYQDTMTPAPADRDRIFAGHPASKKDDAVLIGVQSVSTGSDSPKAGVYSTGHRVQVTIEYAESYFERRGVLSMHDTRDYCADVFQHGGIKQYPEGPEGGSTIEPVENGYRQMVVDFRVTTIHGCKS